ncbi:MAG: 50S ribosomal protein L21e [Candidatus Thermoplasmatota archaeon]
MISSKGLRAKTRKLFRQRPRERGKVKVTSFLKKFSIGEKVCIGIDSRIQKGQPYNRYQGMVGKILGQQGRAYLVEIENGRKKKTLIACPEHLKKLVG